MNVLDVLRGARHVGEVAARAVLAALRLSGRAARVHEEERRFGVHRDRLHPRAVVVLQDLVDEEVAAFDHRRRRGVLLRVALPDEDLVDLLPFLLGGGDGDLGGRLVVDHLAAAVVAVHVDEDAASRVGGAQAARLAGEAAEDDRVDDAEPRAGEHRDRQLGHHRHVDRDAVARLQAAEVPEKRGELVHAGVELLVRDRLRVLVFRLGDEDEGRLVLVLREMAVDAVVGGVELAADEPFPERRVAACRALLSSARTR